MARVLVKKNITKAIRRAAQDGSEPPDDKLAPGHMVRRTTQILSKDCQLTMSAIVQLLYSCFRYGNLPCATGVMLTEE
jgi:hypothetical protein